MFSAIDDGFGFAGQYGPCDYRGVKAVTVPLYSVSR